MSAGRVDQEFVDAWQRAEANAKKRGMTSRCTSIYYDKEGKRHLTFQFFPIEKPAGRKSDSQKPSVERSDNNRPARVSRGVRTRAEQGDLDLD